MRMADRFPGSSTCDKAPAIASALPWSAGFAGFPLAGSLAAALRLTVPARETWKQNASRAALRTVFNRRPSIERTHADSDI
jgi:hypothetical protein